MGQVEPPGLYQIRSGRVMVRSGRGSGLAVGQVWGSDKVRMDHIRSGRGSGQVRTGHVTSGCGSD